MCLVLYHRKMPTVNKRVSVTLTPQDEALLDEVRAEHVLLVEILDLPHPPTGDASTVHALMRLGIERLREQREERGYAALAESMPRAEAAERRAVARRPRALARLTDDA